MNDINNTTVATGDDGARQHAITHDVPRRDGTSELSQDNENLRLTGQPKQSSSPQNEPNDMTRHSMANREPSGHSASGRDDTRSVEASRGETRQDGINIEMPSDSESLPETSFAESEGQRAIECAETEQPRPLADWVDIETTCEILREEGVTRTIRTIQRMCKRGDLEARLVPTENGTRYLIERGSIHEFVERHNQMMPTGKGRAEIETSIPQPERGQTGQMGSQADHSSDRSHMQDIIEIKDDQITFLKSQLDIANKQIEMKDEQINTMLERDHETNVLIQNLQSLMALPEANKRGMSRNSIDVSERNSG